MICKQYCDFVTFASGRKQDSFEAYPGEYEWHGGAGCRALQNQNRPVIVDVGSGWAGHDEIMELFEERVGIMSCQ